MFKLDSDSGSQPVTVHANAVHTHNAFFISNHRDVSISEWQSHRFAAGIFRSANSFFKLFVPPGSRISSPLWRLLRISFPWGATVKQFVSS